MVWDTFRDGSPIPESPEEQLARALENTRGLAEYARTQHLILADEVLTELIAFLVTRCEARE